MYSRVFNATTGNNITSESRVNHYTLLDQRYPSICALSSDTFVVAWQSLGQDDSGYGVYARAFDATTGKNITSEFRVNHYALNTQYSPSICTFSSDTFAVAWTSDGQDGSGDGVYVSVFGSPSTSQPSSTDDDDDDEEEFEFFGLTLIIVGITSAVGVAGVAIYLIRKRKLSRIS
ncbi:MAG: hypothetical protein ACFE95_20035 [Candidatus Hodarchaeota archaeon]